MKTVARCCDAGLALAALARLGGAVDGSPREGPLQLPRFLTFLVRGYSPSEGSPPRMLDSVKSGGSMAPASSPASERSDGRVTTRAAADRSPPGGVDCSTHAEH